MSDEHWINELEIRGIPTSINKVYAHNRAGVKYMTKSARLFRDRAVLTLRDQWPLPPIETPVVVTLDVYGSQADADNLPKLILDAMKKAPVIKDDKWQIVRGLRINPHPSRDHAVMITIETWHDDRRSLTESSRPPSHTPGSRRTSSKGPSRTPKRTLTRKVKRGRISRGSKRTSDSR